MSQTVSRRQRLAIARTLPAATCPACGIVLERVPVVSIHVKRCDERLAAEERQINAALAEAR